MHSMLRTGALTLGLFVCAPAFGLSSETPVAQSPFAGLDTHSFPITTDSEEAQAWFDRGVLLLYGFNHGEAIRSFEEAARLDPQAAMPWWGIAYANGMHINFPEVTEEQWRDGHHAATRALELLDDESAVEQELVRAIQTRTAWPAPEEQLPYDQAFAKAMQQVHERFPDHPEVGVLYVESLMNLQPWDYWTEDLEPKERTSDFVTVLEAVLKADPTHPQACHLYIHAMEAGPNPQKAEAAGDALLDRVPGAGHLQHMPSHIYARLGRYADAVTSNQKALVADDEFFALGNEPGAYYLYHAHNVHFLAYAAMMEGRYDIAIDAARRLETSVPDEALDAFAFVIEGIMPTTQHTLIRFGKWDQVLAEPAPPSKRPLKLAIHYYARGVAFAAIGRTDEARAELDRFDDQVKRVPEDWWIFSNKAHDVLPIARDMLVGELAYREGRLDDAWEALGRAIKAEDRLLYDEPPGWMIPVRHAKGALLMEVGQYEWAERLYREDLIDHPRNGWSLLGLKLSLKAQGREEEARIYERQLDRAWQRVENRPTSSCFCAPTN